MSEMKKEIVFVSLILSSSRLVRCLTRIPEMVSSHAVDPEPLIAPMIALLASNNAEVKRRVCDFLCIASEADEEVRIKFVNEF